MGKIMTPQEYTAAVSQALAGVDPEQMQRLLALLQCARANRRHVFLCGNGGSAANAAHFAQDLAAVGVKAISLSESPARLTCVANDYRYDLVFVKQLELMAEPGDVLIAISASGTSPNIVRAILYACGKIMFGITGQHGGHMNSFCPRCLCVPSDDPGIVESVHLAVFHWVTHELRCSALRLPTSK